MKAENLRRGNFIYSLGQKHKDGTFLGWVNYEIRVDLEVLQNITSENTDFKYSPIPLTKEWLLKFGFVESRYVEGERFILGSFNVVKDDNMKNFAYINIGGNYGAFSHTIKYVHELQNLYYALTGEELTIDGFSNSSLTTSNRPIKTGIIKSVDGDSYFDLKTGKIIKKSS